MKKLIILILFAINIGCEEEVRLIETMVYQQNSCKGGCPFYEITIYANRTLRYVGYRYVAITDTIYDYFSREQLSKLTEAFNECGYFSLKDEYTTRSATDMASAYTSIQIGGKSKSVLHYFGDSSAPERLKNLYTKINEILNTERWTGTKPIFDFIEKKLP